MIREIILLITPAILLSVGLSLSLPLMVVGQEGDVEVPARIEQVSQQDDVKSWLPQGRHLTETNLNDTAVGNSSRTSSNVFGNHAQDNATAMVEIDLSTENSIDSQQSDSSSDMSFGSPSCPDDAILVNSSFDQEMFVSMPITIISQEGTRVKFAVSQTWSSDLICLMSTYYENVDGEHACSNMANVGPGTVREYTAKCHQGNANVQLWVYDPSLGQSSSTVIQDACHQTDPSRTHQYDFLVPCAPQGSGDCRTYDMDSCDEFVYDLTDTTGNWLFSKNIGEDEDPLMMLDAETLEISKTYNVPTGAKSLLFQFDAILASTVITPSHGLLLRVQDMYLNLTFSSTLREEGTLEFAGALFVKVESFETTLQVTANIPSSHFPERRVSLGVRITSETSSDIMGIDSVMVSAICS